MIYKSYLIEKNIKSLNKNLNLFYGENLGLKNEFKDRIKREFKNAKILHFYQDEIIKREEIIYNEIFNLSLFETERIIFIYQVNDKILEILEKIEKKLNNQKIFLFSELLDKKSKLRSFFEKTSSVAIIPCYNDNAVTFKNLILEKLKDFKGLNNENLNLIIDITNFDRQKLSNEIEKIQLFFENKKIERKELEILLNLNINENFNILKDEVLQGNKEKVNKLMNDTLIETDKSNLYLSLINQRLAKIADVYRLSKGTSFDAALNTVKPPIFWKDKPIFISQAKKWSVKKINRALQETFNLELKIKSNQNMINDLLIKKLLIDICLLANS